jgi:hypothetical protein
VELMDRKLDLKVGQKVAVKIEEHSNASRHVDMNLDNIDKWCFDGEVTKIGKKYITVSFKGGYNPVEQFIVDEDYSQKVKAGGSNYRLYSSKEEVIREYKSEKLYTSIRNNFNDFDNNNKFSLEQLEKIMDIINKNND